MLGTGLMSPSSSAYNNKGKYSPSLEAAFRIAQVFDVPLGEVFQWDEEATPLSRRKCPAPGAHAKGAQQATDECFYRYLK